MARVPRQLAEMTEMFQSAEYFLFGSGNVLATVCTLHAACAG